MKINRLILLSIFFSASWCFSQIPVEMYRQEIEKLETDTQINDYWNNLHKIDQEILVNTTNLKVADSISISNMIKTSLLFDIHQTKGYNARGLSGFLPILNLSHNYVGQSQLAYWSIIEKCAEIGGAIESFGGKYPAYQLESVSLTFYGYSLLNQESRYPDLVKKLSSLKTVNTVNQLLKSYDYANKLRELNEVEILNSWYCQSFKNKINTDQKNFSFVKMSDGALYKKSHRRIQKLVLIKTNSQTKTYQIENDPFDWKYIYGNDGSLSLIDEEENVLITYTLIK